MQKTINKIKTCVLLFVFTMFFKYSTVFASCNTAIFGDKNNEKSLAYWIFQGLAILKYAVPVLVLIFGAIDLFKAAMASSEDKMKAAQKNLIYRFIIGISFFFVETFVGLLLGAASGDMSCYLGN